MRTQGAATGRRSNAVRMASFFFAARMRWLDSNFAGLSMVATSKKLDLSATLEDVVDAILNAKDVGFIVGAGISVSSGIPDASCLANEIKGKYPSAYRKAKHNTYQELMKTLAPGWRHDHIARYVDKAKINLGHLALAQLL